MHRAAGTAAVLFFFFLATGSWISHTSRFDGVASTFSFSVPPPALSPSTLARTRSLFSSRFFHRPEEPPSIVLPSETSFCFTPHSLPPSLSLSFCLSLSLHRLIIYALSIVRARPRLCSHGRASNLIRSRGQRGEKRDGEGVDANPVKRRGGENDGNKKSDTIKGVKVDTIERETATRCTRDLFLQSDLTATPPRGYISAHCLSLACHRSPARRNTFAMT